MATVSRAFEDKLPSKAEIFDYWKDRLAGTVHFIDWGEPSCRACGFHYGVKYDIKKPDASWQEIFRAWDAVPLQRCHIVPRGLGGTEDLPNLFLMCRECHDAAPNTNIPAIFFEWARGQSWILRERARMVSALEAFKIPKEQWELYEKTMRSSDFKAWSRDRAGLHRPQSNYAATSHRLTYATMIGLVNYFIRRSYTRELRERDREAAEG